MPTYSYRCATCGDLEFTLGIKDREAVTECPSCGRPTRRVFEAPHLRCASSGLDRAVDRAGASTEAPRVVSEVPPAAGTTIPPARNHRYPALPRP